MFSIRRWLSTPITVRYLTGSFMFAAIAVVIGGLR